MKGRFPRRDLNLNKLLILKTKDAVIETYLSCLEERLRNTEIHFERFNSLTKDERNTMYNLNKEL